MKKKRLIQDTERHTASSVQVAQFHPKHLAFPCLVPVEIKTSIVIAVFEEFETGACTGIIHKFPVVAVVR